MGELTPPLSVSGGCSEQFGRVQVEDLAEPFKHSQGDGVVVVVGPQPGGAGDRAGADPVSELGVGLPGRDAALLDQRPVDDEPLREG